MIPIKELINKIKWDKRENPEDYTIHYIDRITKRLKEIAFTDIINIEGNFMLVGEAEIPLHRIKQVRKKRKVIWQRR
jgi:uncharacterized protein (UPF0248 family)